MSQPSAQRYTSAFVSESKDTIVANLPKAGWKNMQQKTPDEFFRGDGHDFHLVSIRVIPPPKRDLSIPHIHHSVVGYRNPVRIASQIGEDFIRRGKGRLAVYDPLPCVLTRQ